MIRNHPRENSLLCVLSGVIFALCYFRVAHIYILVDFLLVGLDIAYIIAIGKFLPKGIANQVRFSENSKSYTESSSSLEKPSRT